MTLRALATAPLLAAALLLALFSAPVVRADEEKARLSDIVVTNTRDDLLVYLQAQGCFTEPITEAVLNGVPTTFSFFVSLYSIRDFWMDKEIADLTINRTIKYDSMKKEFTVIRSEDPDNPLRTHSFSEAKKAMAEVNSLQVVSLSRLEKGRPYQIKAKASLDRVTLPLYLHHVLFFVSLWDFETDWYTINFHY
ncbi:MAG: DUF4390 domain-containing protein [Deltaproteobacteria bacterium]|nr:DUF4390 domain-containing protein [Deltaproteobacteria bacterium]